MKFFSPANFDIRKHYQHGKSGVIAPSPSLGSARNAYWIVGRSLLRLKFVSLYNVPEKKIAEALRLETLAWAPFAVSDYYAEVMAPFGGGQAGGHATAWITAWDRDSVEIAQTAQGINLLDGGVGSRVIPENALQTGLDNGLRVLGDDARGFEAQVWERGVLRHSRWWATQPDAAQWQNFQRSAGFEGDTRVAQMPAPAAVTWRSKPNGFALDLGGESASSGLSTAEILGVAFTAFFLAVPTIWSVNSWWTLRRAATVESARAADAQRQVAGLFDARNAALEQASQAATLHGMFMAPDISTVLAEIAERFNGAAKSGTFQIQEFEVRDAKLRLIIITTTPLSATSLIKALESGDRLRNVQITSESTRLVITANVMPLTNIAPPSAPVLAVSALPTAAVISPPTPIKK